MGATRPTQMLRERALLSSGRTQDTHESEPPTRRFSSISRRFGYDLQNFVLLFTNFQVILHLLAPSCHVPSQEILMRTIRVSNSVARA